MFRIYTEDTGPAGRAAVLELLAAHNIPGATVYNATGVWNGARENSLVIETDGPPSDNLPATCRNVRAAVYDYANAVKRALAQAAVLVIETADTVTVL